MGRGLWSVMQPPIEASAFEKELYNEWVEVETYNHYSNKTTVVIIKLNNGFEIVGTSNCEDPSKFDPDVGRLYALKDALNQLSAFTAFYRAEEKYQASKEPEPVVAPLTDRQVQHVRKLIAEELILNNVHKVQDIRPLRADAHMIDGLSTMNMDIKA